MLLNPFYDLIIAIFVVVPLLTGFFYMGPQYKPRTRYVACWSIFFAAVLEVLVTADLGIRLWIETGSFVSWDNAGPLACVVLIFAIFPQFMWSWKKIQSLRSQF